MAGGGGGQLLAVVHGQRLGCFAVEGVGKAGTPKGLCPGLPWVQRLCPCLERVTVRDGAGLGVGGGPGESFPRRGAALGGGRDAGIWY